MAYGNTDGTEYPGRNLIWSEHNHKLEGRHFWLAEVRGLLLLSIEISAGRYCVSVKNATGTVQISDTNPTDLETAKQAAMQHAVRVLDVALADLHTTLVTSRPAGVRFSAPLHGDL